MSDPIIKTLHVPCPPARAFEIFVGQVGSWWPLDTHAASAATGDLAQTAQIEPHVGGAFYEVMHDGGRDDWGVVKAYDPPHHFATTWHPGPTKDHPTLVDVHFVAKDGGTEVTLTHSGWEIWGAREAELRAQYTPGWDLVFGQCFGGACGASGAEKAKAG